MAQRWSPPVPKLFWLKALPQLIYAYTILVLYRYFRRTTIALALQTGEFVLSGGHLRKTMIGTVQTIVDKKQFVPLKKGEHWLAWFTTGTDVQQNPLKHCTVFETIRLQVREQMAIVAVREASIDEAPVDDLADELELESMGITVPG